MAPRVVKQVTAFNGIPSLVSRIQPENFEMSNCKKAVVLIPGNPGIIRFYDGFLESLYEQCGRTLPLFGIQHAGHGSLDNNTISNNASYNLTEQIEHKVAFIEEYFPSDCQLILIGHSIGAYIILKLLEHYGAKQKKISKGIFLFPTIERMAISPNGRFATPVSNYLSWPVVAVSWGLSCIPMALKTWLVNWWFSKRNVHEDCKSAVIELVTSHSIRNMLFMAADEMEKVDKTPVQLISDHIDKLIFYYGSSDPWVPRSYYNEMVHRFPNGQIYLCDKNIKHAFVLESHQTMAEIVATWID